MKHSIPELNKIKERIKNEILIKDTSRYNIIQILQNDYGYTEMTAIQYYCDIKNEIKDDYKDRADVLRQFHIAQHKKNLEECNQIENKKDQLIVKTRILERMEKITGLEETTVKHEGQINLNISPDFFPDEVIKKLNES